jgi:hypothetical protein
MLGTYETSGFWRSQTKLIDLVGSAGVRTLQKKIQGRSQFLRQFDQAFQNGRASLTLIVEFELVTKDIKTKAVWVVSVRRKKKSEEESLNSLQLPPSNMARP